MLRQQIRGTDLFVLSIEDALLPRVAAFISQFPDYRKIVVYCARKTEVTDADLIKQAE